MSEWADHRSPWVCPANSLTWKHFFLSCTCFQTLRLTGLSNTHITQNYFCYLNKEGFNVQRPMFHLGKCLWWRTHLAMITDCSWVRKPPRGSSYVAAARHLQICGCYVVVMTVWDKLLGGVFFDSNRDEVDAPHLCFPFLWEVECQHSCWLCQPACS